MSTIIDINKIDLIGLDNECNYVNLEIIDSLDWIDEEKHLLLLQKKVNTYLSFIESGQIYQVKPKAKEKNIVIIVAFEFTPTENAIKFLISVANILHDSGYGFEYQVQEPHKLRCIPIIS